MGETLPRLRMLCPPGDLDRATHDQADRMFMAALAEAGHPTTSWWSEATGAYMVPSDVPPHVVYRARRLVLDALGLPYEVIEPGDSGGGDQ